MSSVGGCQGGKGQVLAALWPRGPGGRSSRTHIPWGECRAGTGLPAEDTSPCDHPRSMDALSRLQQRWMRAYSPRRSMRHPRGPAAVSCLSSVPDHRPASEPALVAELVPSSVQCELGGASICYLAW